MLGLSIQASLSVTFYMPFLPGSTQCICNQEQAPSALHYYQSLQAEGVEAYCIFPSFLHSLMRCLTTCTRELRLSLDFCTGKDFYRKEQICCFELLKIDVLCRKVSCNLVFWNCFPSLANCLLKGQGSNLPGWWQHGTMTPNAYCKEKCSLAFTPISVSSVLLCLLQTGILNKHLQDLMEGLTAKVFRTYNASITLQQQLKELTARK